MSLTGKVAVVTGGTRGIGLAVAAWMLERGASVVISGRDADRLNIALKELVQDGGPAAGLVADAGRREDAERLVDTARERFGRLDILVNNAGIAPYDDLSDAEVLRHAFAVNVFGVLEVTRAFLPLLKRSQGAIVNHLSMAALAALPLIPAYSISKAAAFNLTQSLRALLAGERVRVHGVVLGPVDTDMNRGLDIPKATTESAARGIFDGLERGEEDIFPDPASQSIAAAWRSGAAKTLERQFAAFIPGNVA